MKKGTLSDWCVKSSAQLLDAGEAIDVVLAKPVDIAKYTEAGQIGSAMTVSALALAQKHTGYAVI